MTRRESGRDDRAVSFTVSYVLTIAIAVLLVSGILFTAGELVRDQRDGAIRDEGSVVADETAATVMAVDRLARMGSESTASVAVPLPRTLSGQPYTVTLRVTDSGPVVVVRTDSPAVAVTLPVVVEEPVTDSTVSGGPARVVYDPASGLELVEEPA